MKFFCFTIILIANTISCHQESLNGTWVSKTDTLYNITFKGNKFYSVYNNDTINSGTFERSIYTCDSSYIDPAAKADFIFLKGKDTYCFEITGVSDSILAYRSTSIGKLHVFSKKK